MASVPKPPTQTDTGKSAPVSRPHDEVNATGVLTPVPVDNASPASGQGSDAPTLIDLRSDAPTIVDFPDAQKTPVSPSDAATQIDVITRKVISRAIFGLRPGALLANRYEITALLGEGGMGAVYKALDREVNRTVALKVIRPDLATNSSIIDRFKQELVLSHQVTHRNVVRIYDLGEADGVKFITMEYIEGTDLRSIIQERKSFTPAEAVEIMLQVCRALEAVHTVGVIHRDLKPQNIMRDN